MNIRGLTLDEISSILKPCLLHYFNGCQLSNLGQCLSESYVLEFEEVQHLVPLEYHKRYKPTDKFNGASGFIEFETVTEQFAGKEYTAMLLADQDYSVAFLFALEESDGQTGSTRTIILKNYFETEE